MIDHVRIPTGVEFGQCCGSLGDSLKNPVDFKIFNNVLSNRDEKVFLGGTNGVSNCRRSHDYWFDQKEKLFGGLEVKLSISDQKPTIVISGLTRPPLATNRNESPQLFLKRFI
jgi:hypothetical protein